MANRDEPAFEMCNATEAHQDNSGDMPNTWSNRVTPGQTLMPSGLERVYVNQDDPV